MTPFVEPQMQAILNRLRAGPQTDFKTMPIAEARRQSDAATIPWSDGAPGMRTRNLTVDADGHEMRARLYRPRGRAHRVADPLHPWRRLDLRIHRYP